MPDLLKAIVGKFEQPHVLAPPHLCAELQAYAMSARVLTAFAHDHHQVGAVPLPAALSSGKHGTGPARLAQKKQASGNPPRLVRLPLSAPKPAQQRVPGAPPVSLAISHPCVPGPGTASNEQTSISVMTTELIKVPLKFAFSALIFSKSASYYKCAAFEHFSLLRLTPHTREDAVGDYVRIIIDYA